MFVAQRGIGGIVTDIEQHTQGTPEWVETRDGRRLYTMVLAEKADIGTATVVFEAGSGTARFSWAKVQPGVARFARAIVYDRSGLGRSAFDPAGRTLDRMADDLNEVLDHFEPGPFILVGHSAGAPIVRLAAARRPDRVAGLVLVDPTDEAAEVLFSRKFRWFERTALAIGTVLARLRLLERVFAWQLRVVPDDVRRDMEREAFTPGVLRTQRQQAATYLDELATWRGNPPELGSIPVTAISGGRAGDGMSAAMRADANASHAYRAAQSPHGRHVIAEQSSHYVVATEPELIVAEIERMMPPA